MDNSILGLLSWITPNLVPITLFLVILKFLTKRMPYKPLDRFFMKVHIPIAWILLISTVYHTAATLIAGQTMTIQGNTYTIPSVVFVSGLLATTAIMVAVVAFFLRKKLKGKWLQWHRISTIIAVAATAWHMAIWFSQKG